MWGFPHIAASRLGLPLLGIEGWRWGKKMLPGVLWIRILMFIFADVFFISRRMWPPAEA
jgi:hypothetical protein